MRIAICDDNDQELARLSDLLSAYADAHPALALYIRPFSSCEVLWAEVEHGQVFDLCLLDILMQGGMSGIDLAERLARQQRRPSVIFLTQSPEFALDAFRVRAQHYLLKPLDRGALFAALDEMTATLLGRRDKPVTIPTVQNSRITVPMSSIAYTECDVHTIRYHMSDGSVLDSRSIRVPFAKAISNLLVSGRFIQPHRSFAVNLEHVVRLTGQEIFLRNGARVPISRLRLADCRAAYQAYLLGHAVTP